MRHLSTKELANYVVHVLRGFMPKCLKTPRNFSLPWKQNEDMSC